MNLKIEITTFIYLKDLTSVFMKSKFQKKIKFFQWKSIF
ncbi:MAG: hypothetical protein JWP94_1061 [Mucilaginibacter sp.]|nr:hypothetical protein [Mucilaginibacter sp.]